LNYLSVCSGIEAATVAWNSIGFEPIGYSEIDKFCCDLLKQKYPQTPNYGDINGHSKWEIRKPIDILIGGTPCQSFSLAGLRKGVDDPRGGLVYRFCELVRDRKPRWIVWENVQGVLSSNGGRDFGSFIRSLAEFGYHFCWRVLDAQHFGLPHRRKRVFLVGHHSNRSSGYKVLFEQGSLSRIHQKRQNGEAIASKTKRSNDCPFCESKNSLDPKKTGCVSCSAWVKSPVSCISDGAHMGGGLNGQDYNSGRIIVQPDGKVRRLTPLEIERLMGFPDNYTNIPGAKDGNRFKAMSNSMCVPVIKWIGERIKMFDCPSK
jgi:DNA (cytosine-5)-methyltransferase 1